MIEKKLKKYLHTNILAMIGISCYVLADTFFISLAAGANGITALNLTLPIYAVIFAVGSMIGLGSATRYSLCKASGDKNADEYLSNSAFWAVLFSLIFVTLGCFAPRKVLKLMGADDVILKTGLSYMRTVLCFAPAFMLNYILNAFIRNDGAPALSMTATITSNLLNIVLDYIFIFPLGMGMFGAALATGISPVIDIIICSTHFLSPKSTLKFIWKRPDIKKLALACSLGTAGFISEISGGITSMAFNFILLDLVGNIAVAAYGVVANVSIISIAVFNGISQGLQPMASEAEGKADEDAKKCILKFSLKLGIVLAIVAVALCYIFADNTVALFNSENLAEMAAYAVTGLKLYSIGFLIAVINIIQTGFLGATGRARECFIISVSRGVVAIALFVFILSRLFGIYGVWLSFPVSEIFTLIVSFCLKKNKAQKQRHSIL